MTSWQINYIEIPGPSRVVYQERTSTIARLDGVPIRQGVESMDWQYPTVLRDEMALLQTIYAENQNKRVLVSWYSSYDEWKTGYWLMQEPVIGKRQGFDYLSVVIRFTPTFRTEAIGPSSVQSYGGANMSRFNAGIIAPSALQSTNQIGSHSFYSGFSDPVIRPTGISSVTELGIPVIGDA